MFSDSSRYSAVIFDMDGLMLDTLPIYRIVLQMSIEELGYKIDQDFFKRVIGLNDQDFNEVIYSVLGLDFPASKFHITWQNNLNDYIENYGIPVKDGLDQILKYLVELGIPIAIASSSNLDVIINNLRAARIQAQFNCIISGNDVIRGKPNPEIFHCAAIRLGVPSFKCIVLEDSDVGIAAATAAGMFTIMVPDGNHSSETITSSANIVLPNLAEVQKYISALIS